MDKHQDLRHRILKSNLEHKHPELNGAEKARALAVAEAAFVGQISNGQATDIGVRTVLNERKS